jgi:hypothetical protein
MVTAVLLLWIFIPIHCVIVAYSVTTTSRLHKQGNILPYLYCKSYVLQTNDGYIPSIKKPSGQQSTTNKLHSTTDDNNSEEKKSKKTRKSRKTKSPPKTTERTSNEQSKS